MSLPDNAPASSSRLTSVPSSMPSSVPSYLPWALLLVVAAVIPWVTTQAPWLISYPASWVVPLADWINAFMESLTLAIKPVTRIISVGLEWPMLMLRDTLQWLPWPVTVLAVVLLALHAAGPRLATLCCVALLFIALSGYWRQAMNTMALVGIAVPLSLLIGLSIGIAAQRTRLGARVVPPLLDLMQTMPTFAYLVPLLVIFGFGPVVGLIASAIYACPPMVRNVHLGLKRVPAEITEASRISGSSSYQQLFWVELPAAMAQIRVGINQTIMAALSMVIIASVIGGFDDIGWEVLNTMRKARFGESLLAGSVIVLIAVVMDRISSAYATATASRWAPLTQRRNQWLALGAIVILTLVFKVSGFDTSIVTPDWTRAVTQFLDNRLENAVVSMGDQLTAIKNNIFFYYLLPVRIGFTQAILPFTWGFEFTSNMQAVYAGVSVAIATLLLLLRRWRAAVAVLVLMYLLFYGLTASPWVVVGGSVTLLAWQLGGRRVGLFTLVSLVFILVTGMWERAMLSIYLCGAASILAFLLGSSLGVWASTSDRVSSVIRPISDTFQTIPLFVFLIPVLMFFQVGEFTALLAIIAYAFVPAVRYTESGLRQVSPQLVEVAVEQGCTPWQIFWQIRLPLAMPSILVGLNQTIMYAFAMLVIAALVGTTGLGQQIFLALSAADTGLGVIAGLSMALLAMIADRILQAYANRRFSRAASPINL